MKMEDVDSALQTTSYQSTMRAGLPTLNLCQAGEVAYIFVDALEKTTGKLSVKGIILRAVAGWLTAWREVNC